MTIERLNNGSLLISTIHNGHLVKKVYYFFGKREAIKDFNDYLKGV